MFHIQFASDLHLEFPDNARFIQQNPLIPKAEVLVLAGDIIPFKHTSKAHWFFERVSKEFKQVYWLPGNHEYYGYDLRKKCGSFSEKILENVFLVNNTSVQFNSVNLIFSTLWSFIHPASQRIIERQLNDFHQIRYNGFRFSADHFNQQHKESVQFITSEVEKNEHNLVFTHYIPTLKNYPPQFLGDELNEAFAVELVDFIEPAPISHWIYGHHHQYIPDFFIGNTRLTTNQLGYLIRNEHKQFNRSRVI